MIGSLAESLVGAIVGEMAAAQGGGRGAQRGGDLYEQDQRHQQHPQHPSPLASLVESVTQLGKRALAATLTGLQYLLLLEVLLLVAVVCYGALYWLVMPLRLHDKPLYFDYSDRATTGGATATVDFLAQHTQWDPSPLTDVERLHEKVLKAGQHYKVGLELQMPTSYTNKRVGVFMVHTTLLDDEDNELATSARPAMLPHTSWLRKGVGMFFSWPLHLVGLRQEADTVFVPCVDFYKENALHPLTKARVTVSSGRVQFYRSSVHITPQLKGLPWLMHDWFFSTLAAGVLFIASLELMLCGFFYVFFIVDLEAESAASRSSDTSRNNRSSSRAGVRAGASRFTDITGSSATRAGGGDPRQSPRGRYASPGSTAGGTTAATGNKSRSAAQSEGVRQRPNARSSSGSSGGDLGPSGQENAPLMGVMSPDRQPLQPPGVQAYQRGARYVVEDGRVVDTGGAAREGIGAGSGSEAFPGITSQEDLDAAAMASWTALGGNVEQGGGAKERYLGDRGPDGMTEGQRNTSGS